MNLVDLVSQQQMKPADSIPKFNVGDTVRVMETRPMSKSKRWRVVEIVERAR